jgi:hypothetical protein
LSFLQEEHEHIGWSFDIGKTVVLSYKYKGNLSCSLSGFKISFAGSLSCLGMPVGAILKESANLALKNYACKIQAAYASLTSI